MPAENPSPDTVRRLTESHAVMLRTLTVLGDMLPPGSARSLVNETLEKVMALAPTGG